MKHGIYYAYWEQEWAADYKRYVEKVAKLGFDILEIGAAPLPDYSAQEVKELKKCADDNGIQLTAGYAPPSTIIWGLQIRRSGKRRWSGISVCSR